MKREFSAGGVVFKRPDTKKGKQQSLLWLVAKSKPSKEYPDDVWRLPKGWLDDENEGRRPGQLATGSKKASNEQVLEAAVREVKEEGGVEARVIKKIITDRYFYTDKEKRKVLKFVTYYLMEWTKDLKEGFGEETEKIEWLEYEKAQEKLTYLREKEVLEKAKRILDVGMQGNLI